MSSNTHSSTTHKSSSFGVLAWLKARLADIMAVAEVLRDFHYSAPWDQPTRSR